MEKPQKQFIIDGNGNKVAVILPLADYEGLLEDLHDLSVIAERKDEETVGHEELEERLKKDGLL